MSEYDDGASMLGVVLMTAGIILMLIGALSWLGSGATIALAGALVTFLGWIFM